MEPSGVLDGDSSLHEFNKNAFSLYDVADEEVHFTRVVPSNSLPTFTRLHQTTGNYYLPPKSQSGSSIMMNSSPATRLTFTDVNLSGVGCDPEPAAEQLRSNKILNSIGSRLRRGTNYLVLPKLVGQYLLGITIRNWSEFLNTSRMLKAPHNTHQLTRRLLANLNYFQGNYLCVSLVLIVYCILTSPLLMLAIVAYLLALYFVTVRSATGRPLRLATYRPNLQQQYSFITLISLPLLWVAGAPSAVFWVIGASFVVVGLHASMYHNVEQAAISELSDSIPHQQQQQLTLRPFGDSRHSTMPQYLSVPSEQPANSLSNNESSYTSAFSQWMTFGTSSSNSSSPAKQSSNSTGTSKLSNVTIISQDYAGLGRVYEI